jgi:tetratricopeptide (TPR) repeat protein
LGFVLGYDKELPAICLRRIEESMRILRFYPLAFLLLGVAGCSGVSPASTTPTKSAAEWIESGNQALVKGALDQAFDDFTKAADAQSDSAIPLERRAATSLRMGKYDQALSDCNAALKIDGKFAAAYFLRGQVENHQRDKERAVDDLTKAVDNGLERADVLVERGEIYHSQAKACRYPGEAAKLLQKAVADFDRAVKIDPDQPQPRLQRALVGLETGDYANAVADCDVAVKAEPSLVEAYVARARGKCELGETESAVKDCGKAIDLDGNCMEAYVYRARARLEKSAELRTEDEVKDCSGAIDDCQKAAELSKKFKGEGDPEGMSRAASIHGMAHELRGLVYYNLGATKRALNEYGQALSLDAYLVSALLRRAEARSSPPDLDYAGALADCNSAIDLDSARPEAYCGRGMVHYSKFEFDKAIEDFTQAVQLDPRCAKGFDGRALVHVAMAAMAIRQAMGARTLGDRKHWLENSQEEWKKCIVDASEALKTNQHLAKAYLTRGWGYAKLSIADRALADFNAAIREDPKFCNAYRNRAILFFNQRLYDASIKDFLECEKLEPGSPQTSKALLRCAQQKGDLILINEYDKQYQERMQHAKQEEQVALFEGLDLPAKPKPTQLPGLRPDSDLDRLQRAKNELQSKLDSTAEK